MDHRVALEEELIQLQIAVVRRLREKLEAEGPVTPAYLDVARKILADLMPGKGERPVAPPVTVDLPFPAPDDV